MEKSVGCRIGNAEEVFGFDRQLGRSLEKRSEGHLGGP